MLDRDQIDLPNESRKLKKRVHQEDKPVTSARSNNNNLELWLQKKKAVDQMSQSNKQSSSRRSRKPLAGVTPGGTGQSDVLDPLSESSEKDLSYLSKLQESTSMIKEDEVKIEVLLRNNKPSGVSRLPEDLHEIGED